MRLVVMLAPTVEDYCVEYANAVSAACRVTLVCPKAHRAAFVGFVDPAVDLRLVDWPRHRSLRNPGFIIRLARMIRALQPDVVHFLSEGALWLNLLLIAIRRYRIVTTVHDVAYHPGDHGSQRVPRWGPDFLISHSDRLIVHGPGLRADAERRYPNMQGRIDILPHRPITRYCKIAERYNLQPAGKLGVNVLFFGRIYPYKGLDVLIRCSARIIEDVPDIRFVIAGRGEDMERYRQMIPSSAHFDIRDRFIPDKEAAQLFLDAAIVVLPYIEASQSGVLAIANAFGKSIVVTDVGELGQTVQHGVTGMVVPPKNPVALAAAVTALAQDPALRQRLGEAGRLAGQTASAPRTFAQSALRIYEAAGRVPVQQTCAAPMTAAYDT